jgi:DNA-binding MarR family transcriptional regulator
MPPAAENLGEKEFALIQAISKNPTLTQRGLSQTTGLSLGMTNLLIKRLARKGLIKVHQLDWKRTSYLLTFKGALEKSRKAYRYTLYTWRIFRQVLDNIETALRREYESGRREFWFVAQDELRDLLGEEIGGLSLDGARFAFVSTYPELPEAADLVLVASPEPPPEDGQGRRYIRLVDFDNIDFRVN